MPIYAYRCASCGHAQDVLQKMSDPLLSVCPACGAATFSKQLTAAGFQLKGSGWYATDFRNGNNGPKKDDKAAETGDGKPDDKSSKPAETTTASAKESADAPAKPAADKPAADKPVKAAAPATGA